MISYTPLLIVPGVMVLIAWLVISAHRAVAARANHITIDGVKALGTAVLGFALAGAPLAAKDKKVYPPDFQVQPDIVQGCIALRKITLVHNRSIASNIKWTMYNSCGHYAQVSVSWSEFDKDGVEIDSDVASVRVAPGEKEFAFLFRKYWRDIATVQVTDVSGRIE